MTITPVASKSVESISAEPNSDAPVSGFDLLLAGARPTPDRPEAAPDKPESDDGAAAARNDTPSDPTSDATTDPPKAKDPAATDGNAGELLAMLAAGLTAPAPPPVPAPATAAADPIETAPEAAPAAPAAGLVGLAFAPDPTVTTEVPAPPPAATTPANPVDETTPTDPTAPALDDAASAVSIAANIDETTEAIVTAAAPSPANEVSEALLSIAAPPPRAESSNPPARTPSISPAPTAKPAANAPEPAPAREPVATEPTATATATEAANAAVPIAVTVDHARPPAPLAHLDADAPTSALVGNGPAPSQAPSETRAVEQLTTTPAPTPPPAAEQLVHVLTPMRGSANGTYTLHLELKPAELGRVEMRVEMKDGVMHASIHSDHEGSAQLLRDALGELRDRLEAANVHTGDLTVTDGGVGARDHDPTNPQAQTDLGSPADPSTGNSPTTAAPGGPNNLATDTTSLLDVRV